MKQIFASLCLLFMITTNMQAQEAKKDSSGTGTDKDSTRLQKFFAMATYPLIKNSKYSGVIPIADVQEKPDPSMQYKLLIELTLWSKDSAAVKEINGGLAEVGRLINLHVASGIPKDHIHVVIVVHGPALNAFLNDEHYRKKFKTANPNLDILEQFRALGTKFIACGQAQTFLGIPREDMIPDIATALTAQVVLSNYQLKGYVLYHEDEEK